MACGRAVTSGLTGLGKLEGVMFGVWGGRRAYRKRIEDQPEHWYEQVADDQDFRVLSPNLAHSFNTVSP